MNLKNKFNFIPQLISPTLPLHILLTGANGYIGQRLIPVLLAAGHTLYCCVRNRQRFDDEHQHENLITIEVDF